MGAFIDLTGEKYGKLAIIERTDSRGDGGYWKCLCDCGKTVESARTRDLRSGNTTSCGCTRGVKLRTHGLRAHPLYQVWKGVKGRVNNPKNKCYNIYGGRGITICNEWLNNFKSFYDWCLENGYEKGLQLDRIDNDGNYNPTNCRIVEPKVNVRNRRNTVTVNYKGVDIPLAQLADDVDVKLNILYSRIIMKGMDIDEAIEKPVKQYKPRSKKC